MHDVGGRRPRWLQSFTRDGPLALTARREVTVGELKEQVAHATIAERPALCVEICERQLDAADRFYVAGDSDQGKAALVDVTAFARTGAGLCDSIAQAGEAK